ncbi:putative membrane protein [Pontibacter aydingkolensis]|uniref:Uncharacterized protein n=1 Tax=Pontibacter aydingkolensis TaxID=1911536 RepID=A0ABS7CTU7_9BACT|nr:hypothetical protein [Pontibacter aydingkolensis]MBW7467279.1 hypothetical protein [Pontibacter aydingkolensis]
MDLYLVLLNAGSSMMMLGFYHLLFMNAVIGLVESGLLIKFETANRTWLIILANYISMVAGLFFVAPFTADWVGNSDFWSNNTNYGEYQMQGFFFGMFMAFLATILVELPFFFVAIREKYSWPKIIRLTVKVNGITYVIMLLIYFLVNLQGSKW